MTASDRAGLMAAYNNSVVTVTLSDLNVTLPVGVPPPATVPTPAGIITAEQSRKAASGTANAVASLALHALMHRRQLVHLPTVSAATDGSHQEAGWLVCGITQDELCRIGRAFGQLAVYRLTEDALQVVACN